MKQGKGLVTLLMVLVFAFVLTGCGADKKTSAPENSLNGDNASETDSDEASDADGKKIVVGLSNCSDTDLYCKQVTDRLAGMIKEKYPEWELVHTTSASMDPNIQLEQVQSFIARDVDLIIITAADAEGSVSSVDAANEAGIPILTFVNPVASPQEDRIFVGASNILCGEGIATYLADHLPEKGKICIMEGTPGHINGNDRVTGFTDVITSLRPDAEIIASMTGNFEREEALQVTQDWVQAHPQIDAIMCANDEMGLGVVEALRAADRLDETLVCSVDGIEEALYSVQDGDMFLTMFQNYVTQTDHCFEVVEEILIDGNKKPDDRVVEFDVVHAENVDDYINEFVGK